MSAMTRLLGDEIFELTVEYEGHPPGTIWWCYEVGFDFLGGGVREIVAEIVGQSHTETWDKPGCISVTVEGLTKPPRSGPARDIALDQIERYLKTRAPKRGRR